MNKSNAIVTGSIADLATRNNQSIAETFLSCDCVILIDVSGSMNATDSTEQTRYERACASLADLQATLPGKIAVVRFSDVVKFEPSGVPFFEGGGTDLAAGLRFVKLADVPEMKFIVVSDGEPDDERTALNLAGTFTNSLDVIFIGDERSSRAIKFMNKLAQASGGKQITADSAQISGSVQTLLLGN